MTQKKLMRIAWWAIGSFVAGIALLSVLLSFINWNEYRSTLAAVASSQLGMNVELGGDVSLALIPRPTVSAAAVRLSPGGEASEVVATADRLEMRLGLSALLKGRLEVAWLNLDGLDMTIVEAEGGSWQLKGWPEQADTGGEAFGGIDFLRLRVSSGRVAIIPKASPARLIEGLSLDMTGSLPAGPLDWTGAFSVNGERAAVSGRVQPVESRDETALKLTLEADGGTADISVRLGQGDGTGRIKLFGTDLGRFASAAAKLSGAVGEAPGLPAVPFEVDAQLDKSGDVIRLLSRQLMLDATQGRLDLTVATRSDAVHVAGNLSLGIVDLDRLLAALPEKPAADTAGATGDSTPPRALSGEIAVTIEGVSYGGGMLQHVDAAIGLDETGPFLSDFMALAPGGSNLAFTGRLPGHGTGEGAIRLQSGRLQEFLSWAVGDVSAYIQPGRLVTADLKAKARVEAGSWSVTDIAGKVDTIGVSGSLQGSFASLLPSSVMLAIDKLNLDSYLSEGTENGEGLRAALPSGDISFALSVNEIVWRATRFEALKLAGKAGPEGIALGPSQIHNAGGSLTITAGAVPEAGSWTVDATLGLDRWRLPLLRRMVPASDPWLKALAVADVSGQATIAGPLSALRLSMRADHGAGGWAMTGTASLKGESLQAYNLQGNFRHKDIAPAMKLAGLTPNSLVPADLTFSGEQKTAGSPVAVRVSGDLGGGQVIAQGTLASGSQDWQVSFDHASAASAFVSAGLALVPPEPKASLSVRTGFSRDKTGWKLTDTNIRNGATVVRGQMALSDAGRVDGRLAIAAYTLPMEFGSPAGVRLPEGWDSYTGKIDLALENVVIAGQRLDAPGAGATMGDGVLRLDLGAGALVNTRAASATVNVVSGAVPTVSGRLDADRIDLDSFLSASRLGAAVSGQVAAHVSFEGELSPDISPIRTLKAQGTLDGRTGTLNFMAVPKLVREISAAQSGTAFLSSLGGLLRDGTTSYSNLHGVFTLDSGVVLIETANASAEWGELALDGQVNLADRFMDVKGNLKLVTPPDTPGIPVEFKGSLDDPVSRWTTRALEKFVIAGIERRLRTTLFQELETQQGAPGASPSSPGAAVMGRAFEFLGALKKAQEEARKKEEAAKASPQGTGEQKP